MKVDKTVEKIKELLAEKNKTIDALLDAIKVWDELIAAYEEGIKIREDAIKLRDLKIEHLKSIMGGGCDEL